MTPIIILSHNRPLMLMDMIASIEKNTVPDTYEIIICDNASTDFNMKSMLDRMELKYRVFRNSENLLFAGFNPALKYVQENEYKYFILSDPDIILKDAMPKDWIARFAEILDKTAYPKVGAALDVFFVKNTPLRKAIRDKEKVYWDRPIKLPFLDAPCYEAMVDTTLAMYRQDTYGFWRDGKMEFQTLKGITFDGWMQLNKHNAKYNRLPLRVAGDFTAKHAGWWLDRKYLLELHAYYHNSEGTRISSMLQDDTLSMLEEEHGIRLKKKDIGRQGEVRFV